MWMGLFFSRFVIFVAIGGLDGLIRNLDGEVLVAFVERCNGVRFPLPADPMAIREGLLFVALEESPIIVSS